MNKPAMTGVIVAFYVGLTGAAQAQTDNAAKANKALADMLSDGRVLKCGEVRIFKLPNGKITSNTP